MCPGEVSGRGGTAQTGCHRCGHAVLLGTMSTERSHTVPETENGSRLDAFVARVLRDGNGCGVRAAKRLIEDGAVLVDGKPRPAQFKLRTGNVVAVHREIPPSSPDTLVLAGIGGEYLAFAKPAGLHTARIAGSAEPSLEQALAAQWETVRKSPLLPEHHPIPDVLRAVLGPLPHEESTTVPALPPEPPALLSRLDAVTSGIVLAAASDGAASRFRAMEAAGRVCKYYLAVVDGILDTAVSVTNALNTSNRAQTKVLPEADPDPARHTALYPLGEAASFPIPGAAGGTTLAAICIKRGARHQIRAHLAHAGFPICGDTLYGREQGGAPFRLHHARLVIPEFSFFCLPTWLPLTPIV
ncbi:putative Pseudouridine synthase [uncultured delta proteobacterium]|uniref:Putative Pseudouridine synthase n=1 Tax=uncultured delta proteobacterium TaxID=34034 RepID=A0A212J526_9DELT|nr:putative Pseudouridine synthase [uncultured delta proteobacterium]